MRFTIDRMSLLRPLGHVSSVVERRNTIPILNNMVLRTSGGTLSLTGTDMDMDIVTNVTCAVMAEGASTVSAHMLNDIVRKLPEGSEVEIEMADPIPADHAGDHKVPGNRLPSLARWPGFRSQRLVGRRSHP